MPRDQIGHALRIGVQLITRGCWTDWFCLYVFHEASGLSERIGLWIVLIWARRREDGFDT